MSGGKPVKLFLDRAQDQVIAGNRPSAYGKIKIAAKKDGTITAWQSESWATGGIGGGGAPPIPYVYEIPNQRKNHIAVATNTGPLRAWRAPNHQQACYLTCTAMEDLAAKLKMDPVEFFTKNADLTARPEVYRAQLKKGAELIEWNKRWHPRGESGNGPVKRGLGLALHTWGGGGHNSQCRTNIHPDGTVEVELCSQDLGTGTRTIITQGGGRNAGPADGRDHAPHRRHAASAIGSLGRIDHGGRRLFVHSQIDRERTGEAVRSRGAFDGRSGRAAGSSRRPHPGERQPFEEPDLESRLPEAGRQQDLRNGREQPAQSWRVEFFRASAACRWRMFRWISKPASSK